MFSQSGYFRSLLAGTNKESREGKVQFEDIPVYLLARVVLSCYDTDSYPLTISKSLFASHEDPAVSWDDTYSQAVSNNFVAAELAVKMHQLGDRFDIPHLRRLARISFLRAWHNHHDLTQQASMQSKLTSRLRSSQPQTLCAVSYVKLIRQPQPKLMAYGTSLYALSIIVFTSATTSKRTSSA